MTSYEASAQACSTQLVTCGRGLHFRIILDYKISSMTPASQGLIEAWALNPKP